MKKCFIVLIAFIAIIFSGCKNKNDEFIIASILPLTGQGAVVGENAKLAIDFCVEKWNKNNGINGKQITVIHNDSKGEAKQGQVIVNKLLMGTTPSIVISGISGVALSAQPILEKKGIIQQCIVSTDKIFDNNPSYTIRNYLSTSQVCSYFLDTLLPNFGNNKFSLIYANTDYGLAFWECFKSIMDNQKIDIGSAIQVNQQELDYRNALLKLDVKNIPVIFIAAQYQSLGRIVKQLKEMRYNGVIVCDAHLNSPSALDIIGDNRSNLYYIDVYKTQDAENLKKEIGLKYKKEIDDIALIAYNGIDLLLSCIQQNKALDNNSIMKSLSCFNYHGIFGTSSVKNNDITFNLTLKSFESDE